MVDIHPPKQETFVVDARINVDPKGFRRQVDRWELTDNALYMARPADHPRFGYLESWLIPHLDLRVSKFHFREGEGGRFPGQDLYVDIALVDASEGKAGTSVTGDTSDTGDTGDTDDTAEIREHGPLWTTTDLYVDLVTYSGGHWEILDLEELGGALTAGYIDSPTARRALEASQRLVTGMLDAGGVPRWLTSQGVDLDWAPEVTLAPAEPAE